MLKKCACYAQEMHLHVLRSRYVPIMLLIFAYCAQGVPILLKIFAYYAQEMFLLRSRKVHIMLRKCAYTVQRGIFGRVRVYHLYIDKILCSNFYNTLLEVWRESVMIIIALDIHVVHIRQKF